MAQDSSEVEIAQEIIVPAGARQDRILRARRVNGLRNYFRLI
jgi:hypothetical protein